MTRWGDNSQPRWFTLKSFTLGLLTLQSNKTSVPKYSNLQLHENSARHKAVMVAIEQKNPTVPPGNTVASTAGFSLALQSCMLSRVLICNLPADWIMLPCAADSADPVVMPNPTVPPGKTVASRSTAG